MTADMDAILAGEESRFGERVSFMGVDLATPELIREYHADGFTVVVVDARENVRIVPVPR